MGKDCSLLPFPLSIYFRKLKVVSTFSSLGNIYAVYPFENQVGLSSSSRPRNAFLEDSGSIYKTRKHRG